MQKRNKQIVLSIFILLCSFFILPTNNFYGEFKIKVITSEKTSLDNAFLYFYETKNKQVVYKVLSHTYEEGVFNFNATQVCISSNLKEATLLINDNKLVLKKQEGLCEYGAEIPIKIRKVSNLYSNSTDVFSLFLRIFFSYLLSLLFLKLSFKKDNSFKLLLLSTLILQATLLLLYDYNPGQWDTDFINMAENLNQETPHNWITILYVLCIQSLRQIGLSYHSITVLQTIIYSITVSYIGSLYVEMFQKKWPAFYVFSISLLPGIFMLNLYIQREWILMLLFQVCFLIPIILIATKGRIKSLELHLIFSFCLVILTSIRRELILPSSLFVLAIVFDLLKFKYKKTFAIIFILGLSLISIYSTIFSNGSKNVHAKLLYSLSHPISYILAHKQQSISDEDKANIAKFYDVEKMIDYQVDYELYPISQGALKNIENVSEPEFINFYKTMIIFLVENTGSFFEARFKMIGHLYGLLDATMPLFDGEKFIRKDQNYLKMINIAHLGGNLTHPYSTGAIRENSHYYSTRSVLFRKVFFNSFIVLLFLIFILLSFKKAPYSACYSGIILLHQLSFFFLIPSAHFKYISAMYLGGFLLLPLFLLELRRYKTSEQAR